ncbi:hypothetical protein JIN85_20685, partial [Luteolibacter pohnpeiensis]
MDTEKNTKWKPTARQRELISHLADAESYLPTITECLPDKHRKKLRPHHMANFMGLVADLFFTHYEGIAKAFDRNGSLEVTFKAKFAQEKDTVEVSYKPVDTFKDSASAELPDPDQEVFDFTKGSSASQRNAGPVVDAEIVHALPAPMELLPAPPKTPEEEQAFEDGFKAATQGESYSTNPHPFTKDPTENALWKAWAEGWEQG